MHKIGRFQSSHQSVVLSFVQQRVLQIFSEKFLKTVQQTKPIPVATALPRIITYPPSAVKLVRVIKNNFNHFRRRTGLLQDHRIIAAFRKNKNLQNY